MEQTTARQTESRQAPDPRSDEQQRADQQAIVDEMRERDRRDRNRAESPLRPAPDAILLDSTAMGLEEVLSRAEEIVRAHLPQA